MVGRTNLSVSVGVVILLGLAVVGCPKGEDKITEEIKLGASSYDFGGTQSQWTLEVWSKGDSGEPLQYEVIADKAWVSVTPGSGQSDGPEDAQSVSVLLARSSMTGKNAEGVYTATLTVSASNAESKSVTLTARDPQAAMGVSSTALDFGEFESELGLEVWNKGESGSTLDFDVASNQSWLSATPGSATSGGAGDRQAVAVSVDRDALSAGSYTGTLTLTAPGVTARTVSVTAVMPNAGIGMSADAYDFSYDKDAWALLVWNAGGAGSRLEFNVVSNATWLTASPASGTSTGPGDKQAVAVMVDRAAVTQGAVSGVLTISGDGVEARQVNVTARPPEAKVGVSENSHHFGFVEDQWAFDVWNDGEAGSTLTFQVTTDKGWIAVGPAAGSSTGPANKKTVTVTVNRDKMTSKDTNTNGTVQISAAGATPMSITVAAALPIEPKADFGVSATETFVGDGVQFTDKSLSGSAEIGSWLWAFGDGGTSTEQSPSHTYAAAGTYAVSLTVTTDHGTDSKSATGLVSVREKVAPKAAFAISTTETIIGADVGFTDTSAPETAAITSWLWNFGDGTTSQGQHPHHTYDAAGTYTVALTVTSAHGTDSVTKSGAITIKTQAPTADFVAGVTTPKMNETVEFVDRSSQGTADITSWLWNFGDGTTSTAQNPTHAYSALGTYSVALTVTTDHGTNSTTKASYIELQVNPPAADFTGSPLNPDTQDVVQFTDMSTPGDAEIVSWEWNFGDSQTSTERHPGHQYATFGTFTVMLTVTDANGVQGRRTRADYVTVSAKDPEASFTVSDNNPYRWEIIQFTDTSDPGSTLITEWFWDFGDGEVSYAQNPNHMYPTAGTYTVSLRITTLLDQVSTVQVIDVRNPTVAAEFSVDKRYVYANMDPVTYVDESDVEGPHASRFSRFHVWTGDREDVPTLSEYLDYGTTQTGVYRARPMYWDYSWAPTSADYAFLRRPGQATMAYHWHMPGVYHSHLVSFTSGLTNPGDPLEPGNVHTWNAGTITKPDIIEVREPAALDWYIGWLYDSTEAEVEKWATIEGDGYTAHILRLESHRWRLNPDEVFGTEVRPNVLDDNDLNWEHWLTVVVPANYDETLRTALLYVSGGDKDDPMPTEVNEYLVDFAIASQAIVAEVGQVPNQPIAFTDSGGPLSGDALIAFSMDKFLDTHDDFWPALYPMAKSIVRAMDGVQSFLAGEVYGAPWPPLEVRDFVVSGGGNQAWASWLAGAHDERVRGLIPMAYDNMYWYDQLHDPTTAPEYREAWAAYDAGGWNVLNRLDTASNMSRALYIKMYRKLFERLIRLIFTDIIYDGLDDDAHIPELVTFLKNDDPAEWSLYHIMSDADARLLIDAIQEFADPNSKYWKEPPDGVKREYNGDEDVEGIDDWFDPEFIVGYSIFMYSGGRYGSNDKDEPGPRKDWPGNLGRLISDEGDPTPDPDDYFNDVQGLRAQELRSRMDWNGAWLEYSVDPIRYNDRYNYSLDWYDEYGGRLNIPKYVLNGAGDAYFSPDSAKHYFGTLDQPKYLRYFANAGHQILGYEETLLSAVPWFNQIKTGTNPALPYTWTLFEEGTMEVQLLGTTVPSEVNLWLAKDPAGDFRIDDTLRPDGPAWSKAPLGELVSGTGQYLVQISKDLLDYQAYFVEIVYSDPSGIPLVYTTECQIVIPTCPGCTVAPTADFEVDTRTPAVGQAVRFTDTSDAGSSPITAHSWDFGDGYTSTDENPTHAYDAAGSYTVTLRVTSADGENQIIRPGYITASLP